MGEAADVEDAPMNPQEEVAAVVHPVLEGHVLAVGGGKEQEDGILSLHRFCKYSLDFNGNSLLIPNFFDSDYSLFITAM
jgi:hypothetical protein